MHARAMSEPFRRGYLLLEVTLAIALSALVLGAVFQIASWNLKVSNEAMQSSNAQIKQSAFFSFLDRAFLEMSGDAIVELTVSETATHFLSELTIQNAGEIFSWPDQPFTAYAVKLVTKLNRDQTLDILLEYYAEPLLPDPNSSQPVELNPDQEPLQTLILLDDIWKFQWYVWDGETLGQGGGEPYWVNEWDEREVPRYFELDAVFNPEDKPTLHTFWSPQKVDPAVHFRASLRQNTRQANQNTPSVVTE